MFLRSSPVAAVAACRYWFVLLCVTLLCACAGRTSREKIGGADMRVRNIVIHGNEALSDKKIREHLHLAETKWFPLPDRHYFYEGYVPVDRERIVDLYAAYGYHDAEVVRFEVHQVGDREVVDLEFYVDEGEPTLVTDIDFRWPEGPPPGPRDRKAQPERIQTHCDVEVDKPFSVKELESSEAAMRVALQERGYAHAKVTAHANVDRSLRQAEVWYEIVPGPWVRLGDIEIEGLDDVPKRPVLVEVEPYEGKPYSPSRMRRLEETVYGMDVFDTVTTEVEDAGEDDEVPDAVARKADVNLRVTEALPQRVKFGFGLGFEPNRWEQWIGSRYTHTNLFRRLWRLDLELKGGYAELPALYNPEEHGPILLVKPELRKKGLLEKQLVWSLSPSFEVGIWEGYQFYTPKNRIGVSRFFTRFVEAGVSHNLQFTDFFAVSPTLDRARSVLGLDFRDPYLLSYMQFELWLHLTDSLLTPRNGVVLGATYDLAGSIFGGQYDYNKMMPEARAYYTPLKNRLQFAARAQAGFIMPFGDEPGAPFDQKLYLGGSNTVRGWGLRRLSPFVQSCPVEGDCRRIPVGGQTSVLGNFETRVRTWRDLWLVAFFDMGDVQPEVSTFRPTVWNYSVGPGARYKSKIGTFRLDFGVRLNDPDLYAAERRWAIHFGLGEAF